MKSHHYTPIFPSVSWMHELWRGAEHIVLQDPNDPEKVIKVPRKGRIFGHPSEVLREMYAHLKNELPDIIQNTHIEWNGSEYIITQDCYPEWSYPLQLADILWKTGQDFQRILAVNRELWCDDKCIDFLGLEGFIRALHGWPIQLCNILRKPHGGIIIGDFTLLNPGWNHLNCVQKIQHRLNMIFTRGVMQEHMGVDIATGEWYS